MWLGAPFMNRNTQCFALAGKCCGLAASGLVVAARKSRDSRSISARGPNPPPSLQRSSRRVGGAGDSPAKHPRRIAFATLLSLIRIDKLGQVKYHAPPFFQGLAFQK